MPTGKNTSLNAAQIIFNKLTDEPNTEFVVVRKDREYYLALTQAVQDIVAYEKRDTKRPAKSMKVGLMPPKLAQICINLLPDLHEEAVIYDPFCGMGTILQEGWLMGHKMIGSDNSEAMVKASNDNLKWLQNNFDLSDDIFPHVFKHDIAEGGPEKIEPPIQAVVSEPYMGEALNRPLSLEEAEEKIASLSSLYASFFRNVKDLFFDGSGSIVFIWPAFMVRKGEIILFPDSFIDEIENIGYNYQDLVPKELGIRAGLSRRGSFLYARPDALVGREITIWNLT
jgi:tRNA G10  N-methylase Trm11